MGQAKEEWMRQEELEPMYEWIEDNYGDDAGEEGSEEWNEAVKAYEEHCEEILQQEMEDYQRDQYEYYMTLTLNDADQIFNRDISELKAILAKYNSPTTSNTVFKMIYAHAVTILEVYLEDITKSLIASNNQHLLNTIKNVKPFCDTSFKLSEISIEEEGIKKFVIGKISENLYHDIPRALKVLSGVINRKIPLNIDDICRVTAIRHDIVHRNGKDKDGNKINTTHAMVFDALETIENFVSSLRSNLSEF